MPSIVTSRQQALAEGLIGGALVAWGVVKLAGEARLGAWALVAVGVGMLAAGAFRWRAPGNTRLQYVATLVTITGLLLIGLDAAR